LLVSLTFSGELDALATLAEAAADNFFSFLLYFLPILTIIF